MGKNLKKFTDHSNYNTYITGQNAILPNVSYCNVQDEVHYNPLTYTTRELLTILHNILKYIANKYGTSIRNILDSKLESIAQNFNIRLRNIAGIGVADMTVYQPRTNARLIDIDISLAIQINIEIRYQGNVYFGDCMFISGELDEWGEYYVCKGEISIDQTYGEGEDIDISPIENSICILIPKTVTCLTSNEYSQLRVAYIDDNEDYSLDPPIGYEVITSDFGVNQECLSLSLFEYRYEEIQDDVNAAVVLQRDCKFSILQGDFSIFSSLDQYRIPISIKQHEFLTNYQEYL